jgi:hypothetical protein
MYKICCRCKENKDVCEFYKKSSNKDGLQNSCKNCDKQWRVENRCKVLINKQKYRENNKEKITDYRKVYAKREKQNVTSIVKRKILSKNYRGSNRHKINALKAKRRAAKLNATPHWLTKEELLQIQELYEIAQAFKLYTGQEYHVDHIIPLQGENVCGLHVPWNLQVLEASENLSKSNKLLQ